jgi:Phytanoyl-CoA dioxygenase (PhyH)
MSRRCFDQEIKMDELVASNDIVEDWQELRARLREDGYIFVRGLVDPNLAVGAGAEALAVLAKEGWTDDEARPLGLPHQPEWTDPGYRGFGMAETVNRLPYELGPQRLMALLLGNGAFVYPVKVPRAVYPDRVNPNHKGRFVHQDYGVLGKQDMFTMWLPLEDIPLSLGPLAVRPGSSRRGWSTPHRLSVNGSGWSTTDFRPGDALVFHCLTWHAALPNDTDRLRLSVDVRWQLADDPAPSRLLYGPAGPSATGGGELFWRLFGSKAWWRPVPSSLNIVDSAAPRPGEEIPPSRYVDFPPGQRQPANRSAH